MYQIFFWLSKSFLIYFWTLRVYGLTRYIISLFFNVVEYMHIWHIAMCVRLYLISIKYLWYLTGITCTASSTHYVLCTIMYYYVLLCTTMYYYILLCTTMYYYVLLCTTMYSYHCGDMFVNSRDVVFEIYA